MKAKKPKLTPILISSRAGALAVVSDLVERKLELTARLIDIEKEKERIQKVYQPEIDELTTAIQTAEAGLNVWAQQHPEEFPKGIKSIDLPQARFGFRFGKHKVEKLKSKDTWDDIVNRIAAVKIQAFDESGNPRFHPDNQPVWAFDGEDYIRYGQPELDKDGLLSRRADIPAEALKLAGIRIEQEEFFFFEPKSEVLETTKQAA